MGWPGVSQHWSTKNDIHMTSNFDCAVFIAWSELEGLSILCPDEASLTWHPCSSFWPLYDSLETARVSQQV